MLVRTVFYLFLCFLLLLSSCAIKKAVSDAKPITHDLWTTLLERHVNQGGWVDYQGFKKDSLEFNTYLAQLSTNHPNDKHWSSSEQLAYWINAYNAFTVKIVVDHYPVSGIKEIKKGIPFVNTVWDIKFIEIEDRVYDLNNLEHGIIRSQFEEPRIHFAINCASYSCPALAREAYTSDRLEQQLDAAAKRFINDPKRNRTDQTPAELSKIFNWFTGDFTKDSSLRDFINQYAIEPIGDKTKIDYLDYNWTLNEVDE